MGYESAHTHTHSIRTMHPPVSMSMGERRSTFRGFPSKCIPGIVRVAGETWCAVFKDHPPMGRRRAGPRARAWHDAGNTAIGSRPRFRRPRGPPPRRCRRHRRRSFSPGRLINPRGRGQTPAPRPVHRVDLAAVAATRFTDVLLLLLINTGKCPTAITECAAIWHTA